MPNTEPTVPFSVLVASSDDAIESAIRLMHAVVGATVDLEWSIDGDTGYPAERVYVERIEDDGDVVIRETIETGAPLPVPHGGTWAVPISLIEKVTVL